MSFASLNKSNNIRISWEGGRDGGILLYTAELAVGIFGAKTEFRFVVFQVKQLLWVEGSATFPDKGKTEAAARINCSSFTCSSRSKTQNGGRCVLTVLWSARHPRIPCHTQLEPGPPAQERYANKSFINKTIAWPAAPACFGHPHLPVWESQGSKPWPPVSTVGTALLLTSANSWD